MLYIVWLCECKDIFCVLVYFNSLMVINVIWYYYDYYFEYYVFDEDCQWMFDVVIFVNIVEELKVFNCQCGLMIIILVSGMIIGGCVLYYIEVFGFDDCNVILFVGYQVGGICGVVLVVGKCMLCMFGCEVFICVEVVQLEGFFGYVDVGELLDWMCIVLFVLCMVYFIYGEFDVVDMLCGCVQCELGWCVCVLGYLE